MSKSAKTNWVAILVAAALAGGVLYVLLSPSKANSLATGGPVGAGASSGGYNYAASPTAMAAVQGQAAPVYTGPQPSDLSYQEYHNDELDFAPLYVSRSNEYLSKANPELAAWDSQHLLPNAALSNCKDGAITDGPSFNQLSVFSGNKLFEASMAERYFTEIQPRKVISLADLRPLPMIASSSSTASHWNQSSLGLQDVAGGLTHYNSAFCAQNSYPGAQISTPMPGAVTALGGNPVQTSVGAI